MKANCIKKVEGSFKCADPFLMAVYHKDNYPKATEKLRKGNGADFDSKNAYHMYHGVNLPGFP